MEEVYCPLLSGDSFLCQHNQCTWFDEANECCVIWSIKNLLATVSKQMPKDIGSEVLKDVMQKLKDKQ